MLEAIKLIKIEDFEVGFDRLRKAPLENAGDQVIYDYAQANIGLADLDCKTVLPSTYYALKQNLDTQRELRNNLLAQHQLEVFNLPGIMYLMLGNKTIGLTPPFVETYIEENGEKVTVLQDGVHRFLLAQELGLKQQCIFVQNLATDRKYLPYAYSNSWKQVILGDEVPAVKKHYRRNPPYTFMQPLRQIFDSSIANKTEYGRK